MQLFHPLNRSWVLFPVLLIFGVTLMAHGEPVVGSPRPNNIAEMSLEDLVDLEVVFGASRSDQKITEAPASISVITSQEIRVFGYRTLDDLLRSVRDLYVTNDRQYSYLGMRGFGTLGGYNTRVLMLVDGHRINDGIYDSFLTGQMDMVDMEMVDHVEIIRGPGSAIYGSSAFLAVINVVTRKPSQEDGLFLTGGGGSLGTVRGATRCGGASEEGWKWMAEVSLYDSHGHPKLFIPEYNDPSTNNGIAQDKDSEHGQKAFFSVGHGDWTLTGAYNNRFKGIPTGAYGSTFNEPGASTSGTRGYADLLYRHEGGDWEILGRAFADISDYVGHYVTGSGPTRSISTDYSYGAWCGTELQGVLKTLPDQKITLGTEARFNFRADQGNYDDTTVYLQDRRQSWLWAFYAQDEFKVLPGVILNLGGRYDHYGTFEGQLLPRGALILGPFESTVLKLLAGGAFRAPNAYELYYDDGNNSLKANPGLLPETIQTYEVQLERTLWKDHWVMLSLFRYNSQNLITQVVDGSDGLLVFRNIGRVSTDGLGLEYRVKLQDGLQGRASYSLQRAQDDLTGLWMTDSPQQMFKAGLQVPFFEDRLWLGGECQYTSASQGFAGGTAEGYTLVNLTISGNDLPVKGLSASFSVFNLFDHHYSVPVVSLPVGDTLEQDGVMFWGSLSWKL